jgi:hypothetical protein
MPQGPASTPPPRRRRPATQQNHPRLPRPPPESPLSVHAVSQQHLPCDIVSRPLYPLAATPSESWLNSAAVEARCLSFLSKRDRPPPPITSPWHTHKLHTQVRHSLRRVGRGELPKGLRPAQLQT